MGPLGDSIGALPHLLLFPYCARAVSALGSLSHRHHDGSGAGPVVYRRRVRIRFVSASPFLFLSLLVLVLTAGNALGSLFNTAILTLPAK